MYSHLGRWRQSNRPHTPDTRASWQTNAAGIDFTGSMTTPFAQAPAQALRFDFESLADRFEGEWSLSVAVPNPLFGLVEHSALGTTLGTAINLKAAHGVA